MNWEVKLKTYSFSNPFFTASGCCGYGLELEPFCPLDEWGAIVVKGLSLQPRPGNPGPRIWETPSGMINAIGLENIGIETFIQEKLPLLKNKGVPIIANLFGETLEDYEILAKICEEEKDIFGIELNLSCPNVKRGGMQFGVDEKAFGEVLRRTRKVFTRMLLVKLTPNVASPVPFAHIAEEEGADGVTAMNTYRALSIDIETRKPQVYTTFGGLSGPAIKPLTLRMVREIYENTSIPIVASGGIISGSDVIEYFLAGASAVEIGTLLFREPDAVLRLKREVAEYAETHGITTLSELTGKMKPHA